MAQDNTIDYYLKTTWQSIANKYNQLAAPHGFTQATGYVLINIHRDGTPVTKIAALLGVKSTSLSRILNGLEQQKLIYRQADHLDKRSVRVFLTEEGEIKRKIAKELVKEFNGYLDNHIKEVEKTKLINTLKRLTTLANDYESDDTI